MDFIYDGISWDIQWVYLESNLAMDITHLIDSFPSYIIYKWLIFHWHVSLSEGNRGQQ